MGVACVIIDRVAPHAGAWIETDKKVQALYEKIVAPHAGAWIETLITLSILVIAFRRAPRGRVD